MSEQELKGPPFLYAQHDMRVVSSGVWHTLHVRCANQGYGHRHDPTLMVLRDYPNLDFLMRDLQRWAESEGVEVAVGPEAYFKAMKEAAPVA